MILWSPLAKGRLARKPSKERNETFRAQTDAIGKRFFSDQDFAIAQRVYDVAQARGLPMAQAALAWMLARPVITAPIIGATKLHHLDDAVAALSVQLTTDEIQEAQLIWGAKRFNGGAYRSLAISLGWRVHQTESDIDRGDGVFSVAIGADLFGKAIRNGCSANHHFHLVS